MTPYAQSFQHRRRAFTLVELLIVIVIMCALVALVLPMLRNIRKAAGSSKTVSNLRQIQAANVSFASDNNGFFLGNAPFGDGTSPWSNPWFSYMPFVGMLGVNVAGEGDNGNSLPDAWDKNYPEVLKCGLRVTVSTTPQEENRNFTIAMNWSSFSHLSDGTPGDSWWTGGKILQNRVKNPSLLIMFYESSDFGAKFDDRLKWKSDGGGWNSGMAFRNKGKTCNVVFADGHVSALTRKDVEKDNSKTKRYFLWNAD